MIVRHIPMKSAKLSSFSSLVKYITNEQNKQERVGTVRILNCNSIDTTWAIEEVLATQAKNQRAKGDKTYHMLISFAPSENPSDDILAIIEDKLVASIDLNDHQRVSVVHHDTDNLHIHVAINKIHPISYNMIEPYRAYRAFSQTATLLEKEFGLVTTNHKTRKSRAENLADDMEQHSGIESLINWLKRNCKSPLETAESWTDFHQILSQHGMAIGIRGNGLVFKSEQGLVVKASSISRNFSKAKLESKFGSFVPLSSGITKSTKTITYRPEPLNKKVIGSELYQRYCYERKNNQRILSDKLRQLRHTKAAQIEQAKKRGRLKRAALKAMNSSRTSKKYLYQQISKTLMNDLASIRLNYTKERYTLNRKYSSAIWADWLKQKAEAGDADALKALRYRNKKNQRNYTLSSSSNKTEFADIDKIDSITKEGTEIYKLDKEVIRNNGHEIQITKGGSIDTITKALEMARKQYGQCIQVNGSPLFKQVILQITVNNNIPITFADPAMEQQRINMTSQQEAQHEQSRCNDRARVTASNEITGTACRNRRKSKSTPAGAKPNAVITRQGPPAQSQDSLRNLSQLDVVQLPGRGKVLLPNHAPNQLEQQRLKPNHPVRR